MNPSSEDTKQMLAADIDVDTTNYPISIGGYTANNPNSTFINDVPGGSPQLTFNKDERYEFPAIQIMVRTTDYLAGWAHIESIKKSLHGRAHEQWNDALYLVIKCLNDPGFLKRDDNQRILFVINFTIQRRQV